MILTGSEIIAARHDGQIRIDPFDDHQVNPNSYNVRLGPRLLTYTGEVLDPHRPNPTREHRIGPGGFVMEPGELYLGHTVASDPRSLSRCCSAAPPPAAWGSSWRSPRRSATSATSASGPS